MSIFLLMFLVLFPSLGVVAGQKYNFPDPKLNDEFTNVYKQISGGRYSASPMALPSRTLAQLEATTFRTPGEAYYCSDCSTDSICISTGAALGAIVRSSARGTACQ